MSDLPLPLQNTLERSKADLKALDDRGILDVIKAVYDRCLIYPAIWQHFETIFGGWTYPGGHNVSQGFNFTCSNPDAFVKTMRSPLAPFCEDAFNVHGERDCFRELVKTGPGLHICITQPQARVKGNVPHDIHIDRFQVVCTKVNGFCNFAQASAGAAENFKEHMKEAIPWMVGEVRKNAEKRAREEIERFKKIL